MTVPNTPIYARWLARVRELRRLGLPLDQAKLCAAHEVGALRSTRDGNPRTRNGKKRKG